MNNAVLQEILDFAIDKLKSSYGFCGVASGDDMAMINSDDGAGNDIKINITITPED